MMAIDVDAPEQQSVVERKYNDALQGMLDVSEIFRRRALYDKCVLAL
jgi:hypothetical protein